MDFWGGEWSGKSWGEGRDGEERDQFFLQMFPPLGEVCQCCHDNRALLKLVIITVNEPNNTISILVLVYCFVFSVQHM